MSKLVNFVDAWHPCHSHQSKITPFRIRQCIGVSEGKNDLLTSMYNVRFLSSFYSSSICNHHQQHCHYLYLHSYHIITYAHISQMCHNLNALDRENETLMQLSIYTLAIVAMGPCLASDFFGMLIIHEKGGWLWFLQFGTLNSGTCILNFQNFTNWDSLMSTKFFSCSTNLAHNWNSSHPFRVRSKQKKTNLIEIRIRDNNDHFRWLDT